MTFRHGLLTGFLACLALFVVAAALASGHRPGAHKEPVGPHHWREYLVRDTDRMREAKCLGRLYRQYGLRETPPKLLRAAIRIELRRRADARRARSRCLPTTYAGIIRYTWPAHAEDAAIRVSRCETVGWTDFVNDRSSARGLFQLLAMHWAGRFNPMNHLDNSSYAARLYARYGWDPWRASIGCHGLA